MPSSIWVKYVYAGASSKGFDCSGYTMGVMKHFGYNLPIPLRADGLRQHRLPNLPFSPAIWFSSAIPVVPEAKAASHVGIYIGSNQFIHASSGGGKVQIDSLSKAYYKVLCRRPPSGKIEFYISKRLCRQNRRSFLMFFDSGSFPFPSLSTMR